MDPLRLDRMTWPEVEQARDRRTPVLVPMGTIETQGLCSPMGSDSLVAESLAIHVAQRFDCVVVPAVPFGYSHFSKSFPGTISLRPRTLFDLMLDVLQSLADHGFDHFLILNNHGQQEAIVGQVCDAVREQYGIFLASIFPTRLARDLCADLFEEGAGAFRHGGEATISRLLNLYPDNVRMERAEGQGLGDFRGLPLASPLAVQFGGSIATFHLDMNQVLPSGGYGDPSQASAQKGRVMMERMVDYLVEFLAWFRDIDTSVEG